MLTGSRYAVKEASTETHRSSAPYKAFRAACASEALLDRGSDLRYMEPLSFGFMHRSGKPIKLQDKQTDGYVVVESFDASGTNRDALISQLVKLSELAGTLSTVESFWPLAYRLEDNDPTIVLFQRFASSSSYESGFAANSDIQRIQ